MPTDWFALQVRPNAEHMVSVLLRAKGYEEFYPTYISRRRWSDRIKNISLPLFPGYVFCQMTPDSQGRIVTTPGVRRIVGYGSVPVSIEEHEIAALRRIAGSGVPVGPHPFLTVGDRVQVEHGPLAGVCGVIVKLKSEFRLVVSVTLLQRSVSVQVDRDQIRPEPVNLVTTRALACAAAAG